MKGRGDAGTSQRKWRNTRSQGKKRFQNSKNRYRKAGRVIKRDHTESTTMQSDVMSRTRSPKEKVIGWLKFNDQQTSESSMRDLGLMTVKGREFEMGEEELTTNSTNPGTSKVESEKPSLVPFPEIFQTPSVHKIVERAQEHNKAMNSCDLSFEENQHNPSFVSGSDSGVDEQESIILLDSNSDESPHTVPTSGPGKLSSTEPHYAPLQIDENEDRVPGVKRVSKLPWGVAKLAMSNATARKKAFHRLSLRNSRWRSRLLLKKFSKRNRTPKVTTRKSPSFTVSTLGAHGSVPMEVLVKKKLNYVFEELSSPANANHKSATPVIEKFNFLSSSTSAQNVVSCRLPCDASSDIDQSEIFHTIPKEAQQPQKIISSDKRDVCYIFAMLDKEKDEALFKCSSQLKSSQVLQQLTSVIETITADHDIMISNKVDCSGTAEDKPKKKVSLTDRATSPVPHLAGLKSPGTLKAHEDGQANLNGACDMTDRQLVVVNTTIKVIVSKALLSFTSELKILADISVRLLSWCSVSVQGDIDSDMVEDELEAFLCLSHDKVSILIECLSVLDSKQILNVDEVELKRFWLLHDAVCCMLQAYRYLQFPLSSSTLGRHLLSLLTTCSKMILPSTRLSVDKWTDLMKMVCGIGRKLCESEYLSDPCKCYQCFEFLRKDRFCRVCDVDCLYEELCHGGKSLNLKQGSMKNSNPISSDRTDVEKLFPRFCWFLNTIEEWSQAEFKAALAKHSVVKFSCNVHSGLYPCNLHMSEIACRCFASESPSPAEEDSSSVDPDRLKSCCVNVNSESSSSDTSEDPNLVPPVSMDKGTATVPATVKFPLEHSNAVENVDLAISSSSDLILPELKGQEKSVQSNASNVSAEHNQGKKYQEHDDTSIKSTASNECETLTLTEDELSSSTDNFTLRIVQSSSETDQESSSHHQQSKLLNSFEQSKISNDTNDSTSNIESYGDFGSAVKHIVQNESSDTTVDNTLSPSIDYSPLNFQKAKSNIKSAYSSTSTRICSTTAWKSECVVGGSAGKDANEMNSSFDSQQSMPDSQKSSLVEIIYPSSEDSQDCDPSELMKDVSIGDDSVFECSQSEDLSIGASTCGNRGSITSSGATSDNTRPSGILQNSHAVYVKSSEAENMDDEIVSLPSSADVDSSSSTIKISPTKETGLGEVSSSSLPEVSKVEKRKIQGGKHNAVQSEMSFYYKRAQGANRSSNICSEKAHSKHFNPRAGNRLSRMKTNLSQNTTFEIDKASRDLKESVNVHNSLVQNEIVSHEEMANRKSNREVNQEKGKRFEQSVTLADIQHKNGESVCTGGHTVGNPHQCQETKSPEDKHHGPDPSSVSLAKHEIKIKQRKRLQLKKKADVTVDHNHQQSRECQVQGSEKPVLGNQNDKDKKNSNVQESRKQKKTSDAAVAENDDLQQRHQIMDDDNSRGIIVTDKNKYKSYSGVEDGKKVKKSVKFAMDCVPAMEYNISGSGKDIANITLEDDPQIVKINTDSGPKREKIKSGRDQEKDKEENHSNFPLSSGSKVSHEGLKPEKKSKESKKRRVVEQEGFLKEEGKTLAKKTKSAAYVPNMDEGSSITQCVNTQASHYLDHDGGCSKAKNSNRKRRSVGETTSVAHGEGGRKEQRCHQAERKSLLPYKFKSESTSQNVSEHGARTEKKKKSSDAAPNTEDKIDFETDFRLLKNKKSKKATLEFPESEADWNVFIQNLRDKILTKSSVLPM